MKARQIAVVACRALAIYMLITTATRFVPAICTTVAYYLKDPHGEVYGWLAGTTDWSWVLFTEVLTLFVHLGLAALLWFFAGRIARRMVPDEPAAPDERPASGMDIQTIGISLIGLFVLARGIPLMVNLWAMVRAIPWVRPIWNMLPPATHGRLAEAIAHVVIGAGLLIWARKLARALGTARPEVPEDSGGGTT